MVSISEFVLNLVATTMPLSYVSLIPPERQLKTFVYREAHILMAVATKFCPNLWRRVLLRSDFFTNLFSGPAFLWCVLWLEASHRIIYIYIYMRVCVHTHTFTHTQELLRSLVLFCRARKTALLAKHTFFMRLMTKLLLYALGQKDYLAFF